MKIIMVSCDRKLFDEESAVRARHMRYGEVVDEIHIIVCALSSMHLHRQQIAENVWIYPTSSFSRWLYMFDAFRIGKRLPKPVLVVGQDPFENGLAARWIAKYHSAKLQLQVHTDFLNPYFRRHSLLNKVRVYIASILIKKADCVRVVSERVKTSLEKGEMIKSGVSICVLPIRTGISVLSRSEQSAFEKQYAQFNFIALMVCRLEKEKQIDIALRAWKRVVEKYPKAGLIIVGDGREKGRLEDFAYSLGITKNIVFAGWQDVVAPYYAIADVFLVTSAYEGYGMVLLEAAMARLSIVTTDVGIADEVFKDGESALFVPNKDEEATTYAIVRIIEDNVLRDNLAIRGREAVLAGYYMSEDEYLKQMEESFVSCL
jgi:glycosyltransferase involved in cell wall biosynthesis